MKLRKQVISVILKQLVLGWLKSDKGYACQGPEIYGIVIVFSLKIPRLVIDTTCQSPCQAWW